MGLSKGLSGVLALLAVMAPIDAAARTDSLAPDLAINFSCATPPSESAIEDFLKQHRFVVANYERVRRSLGLGFYPLEIDSLDARNWEIHFIGLRAPPGEKILFSAGAYSPPPTQYDRRLEDAVVAFVSQTLKCAVTSTDRGDNGPEARGLFDQMLSMQKNRMHEAAVCDKNQPSYDAAACSVVPRP